MLARKTVTILFCDVADSTPLGEQLDPESLQRVMARWFADARSIIERHGGTVEKFIGDEVMAVFGVPVVHEDDALRAVRAAAEMRTRLNALNRQFETDYGVRVDVRMGINTGEVVAGDPASGGTFVTGEAVNLAKRLEQAAGPGDILIGKTTYPLVRDAVRAGPLKSFPVKGKGSPVAPWRVEHVDRDAAGVSRRLDAPLVGRRAELTILQRAFEDVDRDGTCRLVTVLGPAGIGKSRLALELVASIAERARPLTGRCLPYGEGITFWPIVQILREVGGEEAIAATLEDVEDAGLVIEGVRAVLGVSPVTMGSEETFWAIRRFLEALARERPLVVVFEDIHWAEPTFLDLIEYLHGWTRDVPVLLVCLARPELLERRTGWAAPRPTTQTLVLEPLSDGDASALLADAGNGMPDTVRSRIVASAEGNPLFVEQMAALAVAGDVVVPPTIQALLGERLDRLGEDERAVLECAAIVGREFPRGAVVDLCPRELRHSVGGHLMELVRKELVHPELSGYAREDGFRFRHGLIRDAAYERTPKERRADLHQRFATWIEEHERERATELEGIVGYHLEQAYRLREQLGPSDARARALAERAADVLGRAGCRALAHDDKPAAANLLGRAIDLLPRV
ncbi:MAG: AAA family ATPase, partial [Actinomycetota bacterium]|nr:AAA family ATPase [Actinomycetota bacterium]